MTKRDRSDYNDRQETNQLERMKFMPSGCSPYLIDEPICQVKVSCLVYVVYVFIFFILCFYFVFSEGEISICPFVLICK